MKMLFLILFLPVLVACGGTSDSATEPTATLDITLGEGVRGTQTEPDITDVTPEHNEEVFINTRLSGSIGSETNIDFNYTPTQDTLVALMLTGTAQDLDISISGTGLTKFSIGDTSNEGIVFNAVANQAYVISMVSWLEGGSFELKIVEGNRASVGLANDEYFVELLLIGGETCNGEAFESAGYTDSVFNFVQGYVADINGLDKVSFDRVSGNTLIKDTSYNQGSEAGQDETRFTISPDDGVVNGSKVGVYNYNSAGEAISCSYTYTFTGGILL